jgi:integrase
MQEDHIVPLSNQAIAILREIEPLTGGFDFVFSDQFCQRKI